LEDAVDDGRGEVEAELRRGHLAGRRDLVGEGLARGVPQSGAEERAPAVEVRLVDVHDERELRLARLGPHPGEHIGLVGGVGAAVDAKHLGQPGDQEDQPYPVVLGEVAEGVGDLVAGRGWRACARPHVFAEYGYAAGTTNRIAERARISIGSLYQYYPNKDAILVELLNRHLDAGTAATARQGDEGPPRPLKEVISGYVRLSIANHLDDPQLLRVMMEQAPRSPELLERTSQYQQARTAYVRELIENHPESRVDDMYVAARLVVSTVELLVHQLIAAPDPLDPARLENELITMLTRYLTGGPQGEGTVAP
jgi:AcrR family transcriptional regulator